MTAGREVRLPGKGTGVTTLYSATSLGSTLTVECDGDIVHLTAFSPAETRRAWANPKRADLLAALDAVPRERMEEPCEGATKWAARADKAEASLAEAEDDAATAQAELRAVTAEHDALAATVERVREVLDGIGRNSVFVHEVRAALDPTPALPTKPGSVIIATEVRGKTGEWIVILDEDGDWYGPNFDGYHFHEPEHITGWKPAKVVAE